MLGQTRDHHGWLSPYKADLELAFLSLVRPSAAVAPLLLWAN